MNGLDRRDFLKGSIFTAAALGGCAGSPGGSPPSGGHLVDTNVSLMAWPFRRLKYESTKALVAKLRRHRIREAWAGTYEALLHKNVAELNARLAAECRERGEGMLIPFGTVNPAWPDWQEDLRRCHEVHRMAGIRLLPNYHGYKLDHPEFARLLGQAARRGLIVQIAVCMDDERIHHPRLEVPPVDVAPLPAVLEKVPAARVQVVNAFHHVRGPKLKALVERTKAVFDVSHLEGVGAIGRSIEGIHGRIGSRIPADRLLLGTNAPYWPVENALQKLFESPLTPDQMHAVTRGNATRLRGGNAAGGSAALTREGCGLPSREELVRLRIWDGHYHGINLHETMAPYFHRMGIERMISLDLGMKPEQETGHRALLEKEKNRLSGMIRIYPSRVEETLGKMERWIRNGPAIGIKYEGGRSTKLPCSHPDNDPIIRLAKELRAVVYIHSWLKVGGDPRTIAGDNNAGESTPMDVAALAKRFPDVPLICGHSGGSAELGVRAIRPHKNVLLEFSGSDSHSGEVDYAVKELGADRIVWGGHGPSRSYSTELSKVLDADLTHEQRMLIFGRNYRRIAAPILRSKGVEVVI